MNHEQGSGFIIFCRGHLLVRDYQAAATVVVRLCWPAAMSFCFIKQIAASRCELQIPRLEIMDQLGHYEVLNIVIQLETVKLVLSVLGLPTCISGVRLGG